MSPTYSLSYTEIVHRIAHDRSLHTSPEPRSMKDEERTRNSFPSWSYSRQSCQPRMRLIPHLGDIDYSPPPPCTSAGP